MSKRLFIDAVCGKKVLEKLIFGTGTSIVCQDIMRQIDVWFPEAHLDAEKMAQLAMTGHTLLDFDVVMPLFSVCHEAAAMGCNVNWGRVDMMPESGRPIFKDAEDIRIPENFLKHPGCAVPVEAIKLLKKRLGNDAAVCGKVFGPWTQAYHYFGIENFLMMTIDDPEKTKEILEKLLEVTIIFADAQIEAGADCLLLADHATSDICSPRAYQQFLMPVHKRLAKQINCPLILHICGNTADRIEYIRQTGLDCFHWDTKTGPAHLVREMAGPELSLMGGISNYMLLSGSPDDLVKAAAEAGKSGIDIIGPECAVPLSTPLENLKAVASSVKDCAEGLSHGASPPMLVCTSKHRGQAGDEANLGDSASPPPTL